MDFRGLENVYFNFLAAFTVVVIALWELAKLIVPHVHLYWR